MAGDYTSRLALLEALKGMPFGAAWDYVCARQEVPVDTSLMDKIRAYEKQEFSKRV
jgi:L-rhamnose isomerase